MHSRVIPLSGMYRDNFDSFWSCVDFGLGGYALADVDGLDGASRYVLLWLPALFWYAAFLSQQLVTASWHRLGIVLHSTVSLQHIIQSRYAQNRRNDEGTVKAY